MSSPPISVSRCGYSNSRDVVASSPSFSHPTARGPRRACPAACIGKDILRRNPNPWRPLKSKFCLKTLGRRLFFVCWAWSYYFFPISNFPCPWFIVWKRSRYSSPSIGLAKIWHTWKTGPRCPQAFWKGKKKQVYGWIQQQLVWVDNVSLAVGITVITEKFHDLVNWAVSSLANRPCCLIITVSVNYTTPGVNLIKLLQVSYFLHVVESENNAYTLVKVLFTWPKTSKQKTNLHDLFAKFTTKAYC